MGLQKTEENVADIFHLLQVQRKNFTSKLQNHIFARERFLQFLSKYETFKSHIRRKESSLKLTSKETKLYFKEKKIESVLAISSMSFKVPKLGLVNYS